MGGGGEGGEVGSASTCGCGAEASVAKAGQANSVDQYVQVGGPGGS